MKIVVSGGGTGGHIYPALSFIHEVKKQHPNVDVLYIGTKKGLESAIVPRENIPFHAIDISGFKRSLSFENVKTIVRFIKSVRTCKQLLKQYKPDVVLGTGGYVCGPVVYAAAKLGIPTIIHEQNSIPGLTNTFLSRYVNKVAICFEETKQYFPQEKVVLTGNPRASEVVGKDGREAKRALGLDEKKKTVLIVGGSRGARPINEAFLQVLHEVEQKPYQFLYVTGDVHYDKVIKAVQDVGNPTNVIIRPFIHNMPEVLAGMDMIVARAGATTLAEITALGIPSVLIPSPYVTNNHQEKNARALEKKGAAIVRLESELTGARLLDDIDRILLDEQTLTSMKEAAFQLGIRDAAERLYRVMVEMIS